MCTRKLSRWLLVTIVAVGCDARLSVAPGQSGGDGGVQQAGAGGGGQPSGGAGAGSGGRLISDGGAGSAGAHSTQAFAGAGSGGSQSGGALNAGAAGAEFAGSSFGGAAGAPPAPGTLGQACISGVTVSSGSGVTAAPVTTLNHCSAGLACSAAGICVTMPNCPQAVGPCVVAEVVPSATSIGGAPGSGGYMGSGGAPNSGTESDISGVTGMSTDNTKLYWLEYGTRDALGNYRGDGALMAMDLATEERTPLLSDLPGPIAFGLTTTHVFVFVDGGGLIGSSVHAQLLRFPLQGGEATVIQDGSPPLFTDTQAFVSSGDQAFWAGASGLYSLSGSNTTPSVLSSAMWAEPEVADSETLFFSVVDSFLRAPLIGGAATPLSLETRPISLNGDFIYGLESAAGGTLLTRAAKSNGAWQRIRALGGGNPQTMKMAGDRYFWAWYAQDYSATSAISTASLSDSLPATQIVGLDEDRALYWVGTPTKLYWSDGKRIFSRSFVSQ
jgi:hypothetical protein